jgi:hypothetical protein
VGPVPGYVFGGALLGLSTADGTLAAEQRTVDLPDATGGVVALDASPTGARAGGGAPITVTVAGFKSTASGAAVAVTHVTLEELHPVCAVPEASVATTCPFEQTDVIFMLPQSTTVNAAEVVPVVRAMLAQLTVAANRVHVAMVSFGKQIKLHCDFSASADCLVRALEQEALYAPRREATRFGAPLVSLRRGLLTGARYTRADAPRTDVRIVMLTDGVAGTLEAASLAEYRVGVFRQALLPQLTVSVNVVAFGAAVDTDPAAAGAVVQAMLGAGTVAGVLVRLPLRADAAAAAAAGRQLVEVALCGVEPCECDAECDAGCLWNQADCHECDSGPFQFGDRCAVCKNGKLLLDGRCVDACPPGYASTGSGNFSR